MKKIAVIGTGIMGSGIAKNFLKKGYKVYIWNRSKSRLKNLIKMGGVATNNPFKATQKADIVFEVTANDKSSKLVWTGKDGILSGADSKKVFITCATLSVSWTDKLTNICKKKGLTFFDMPMTGSRIGAESGKLTLLVGGDKKKLETIKKDLGTISEKIFYFGKGGSGMRYKLLLNTLQAIHIIGLGEVLNVAKKAGLNIKAVGDALAERPGGTATNLAWIGYQKEPNPTNFSVKLITKDLIYAKQLAKGLKSPLLDKVLKKYRSAIRKNLGQKDWTVVNRT
ncbi:MAG: NAD(P)-dependent oxidoreductase [Candidatus Woesebacteria bacterium]|nr:NAD(P)-dependent oxidoreductase [Candidatus Woesebacteria bacterium]